MLNNVLANNKFLLENNRNSTPEFPSVYECAALSLDVYYTDQKDPGRLPLPPGWIRFLDSQQCRNDYFGVCYIKKTDEYLMVVIANRGTVLNAIGTIIADLELALGKILTQFNNAEDFLFEAAAALEKKFEEIILKKKFSVVVTGHSLGGILAEYQSIYMMDWELNRIKSITFENPGSKPSIEKFIDNPKEIPKVFSFLSSCCEAYQADVNLINTCNEQVGKVFRLNLPYDYYIAPGPISPDNVSALFYQNIYYLLGYSLLDQHNLENICKYLKANGDIVPTTQPKGHAIGYIAYLDQKNRSTYWSNYITTCWEVDPYLRIKYLGSFKKFSAAANKKIKEIRDIAIASLPKNLIDQNIFKPSAEKNNELNQSQYVKNTFSLFFKNKNGISIKTETNVFNDRDNKSNNNFRSQKKSK